MGDEETPHWLKFHFILQTNGLTYFVTAPTSDEQRNGMKFYLEHKGYGIMVIEKWIELSKHEDITLEFKFYNFYL